MGTYIAKMRDKYLMWSTISDSPVTYGMTKRELERYVRKRYGDYGLRELPARMERVKRNGTSALHNYSFQDLISGNSAGDGETELSEDQLYEQYAYPPNDKVEGQDE